MSQERGVHERGGLGTSAGPRRRQDQHANARHSGAAQGAMGVWRGLASGHGLFKVSPRPAIPDPSTPCGQVTPETTLWSLLWPSSPLLATPRRTPDTCVNKVQGLHAQGLINNVRRIWDEWDLTEESQRQERVLWGVGESSILILILII
jgi:hypothetical protein